MRYSITKADIDKDKTGVLGFWKESFSGRTWDRYGWIYENGYYGPGKCWLVKDAASEMVVGTAAQFPRRILVEGSAFLGGVSGDFGVNKEHRCLLAALELQKALVSSCRKGEIDFLYAIANKKATGVQQRAGFKLLGSMAGMTKILRSNALLQEAIPVVGRSSLFSLPFNVALRVLSKEFLRPRKIFNRIEITDKFDDRFDHFWKSMRLRYPIIGERTRDFLKWRFTECPLRKYQSFILGERGSGNLLGYIVFSIEYGAVQIGDLLAYDEDVLDDLLSEFLLFLRKEKLNSVSIIFFEKNFLKKKLKQYNFLPRDTGLDLLVYVNGDCLPAKTVLDSRKWFVTDADNDT